MAAALRAPAATLHALHRCRRSTVRTPHTTPHPPSAIPPNQPLPQARPARSRRRRRARRTGRPRCGCAGRASCMPALRRQSSGWVVRRRQPPRPSSRQAGGGHALGVAAVPWSGRVQGAEQRSGGGREARGGGQGASRMQRHRQASNKHAQCCGRGSRAARASREPTCTLKRSPTTPHSSPRTCLADRKSVV